MTNQFDTTGEVFIPDGPYPRWPAINAAWRWPDLSPGVQGCIAAMLENADRDLWPEVEKSGSFGFSDLHRDTLARIIAEWGQFVEDHPTTSGWTADDGFTFWSVSKQTLYLNDVGKVCIRECDQ